MLIADDITAEAYYYMEKGDVHLVKIMFQGVTISGIMVKPSQYEGKPLWVEMPRPNGKFRSHYIEFRDSPLKQVIEEKCRAAAADFDKQVAKPGKPSDNRPDWMQEMDL